MNPDELKQAWQSPAAHPRITIDAELVAHEVQRNQRAFTATLIGRDLREVLIGVILIPVWVYLGVKLRLPGTWYLVVPALVWLSGYMLVDLLRQKRYRPAAGASLRQRVESSLAQVEHQISLLRSVHWWGLVPFALAVLPFLIHVAWTDRDGGWWALAAFALLATIIAAVLVALYRLNQRAIRTELEPRRQELQSLLDSLQDERTVENE
jgi:hypothetical protein